MPKFGNLSSKFSKMKVRFEINTFKIEYRQNFLKVRKFILFRTKYPNLGILARNFRKQMQDLKPAP